LANSSAPKLPAGEKSSRPRARKLSEIVKTAPDRDAVFAETAKWLEHVVIGLNLCPFAKAVHAKRQIRYALCLGDTHAELLTMLMAELQSLAATDPNVTDTTLLIHPNVLGEFLDYNDFLDVADAALSELGLEGTLQIASFHPRYQFAGTEIDDIGNYTNRSPFPMLHLLREASVARAVAAFPDAGEIFEKNIETMTRLGHAGWKKLQGN
jgi:hypothetical protein